MSRDSGGFILGFVIGALAGAAAALLMTPYSGEEMRQQIGEKGIELKSEAVRLAEQAKTQAQKAADDARGQVTQAGERGRIVLADKVRKAQQAVQEAEARLGKPAEAS